MKISHPPEEKDSLFYLNDDKTELDFESTDIAPAAREKGRKKKEQEISVQLVVVVWTVVVAAVTLVALRLSQRLRFQ